MPKDLGTAGGSETKASFDPLTSGTPRNGVDEPAKNRQMEFEPKTGFGGTNPGPR